MQPWMSASQQAAQQSHQNAMRAGEQAARSAMNAGSAAAAAAQRGAQFGVRSGHMTHTGQPYRGGDGVVSGFFRLVWVLIKLAMLAGIIAVAVVLIRGR